jgi:5-deoxy-5-amino-3-dehydroquinate synthase
VIEVTVELNERPYPVLVGSGARFGLADVISSSAQRAVLVTQPDLRRCDWFADIDPKIAFDVIEIPEGEAAKNLATVEALVRRFVQVGLGRHDVVVAVGGGIVTDVAGFAAASYHRGTPYVNVATTLLGQVDAAIGGKTGVNLPEGKNLVGAFWQPDAVLCDIDTLETLSDREWACGRGEIAKYAFLVGSTPELSLLDLSITEQVARCAAIKAEVVAADEREGDRRMILNYGHTLAHAIEAAAFPDDTSQARWDIRHGEAVAIGLMFAAQLARRLGRIDDDRVALHRGVVEKLGLNGELPADADAQELLTYMTRDKKAHHDLTFVLDGSDGVQVVRGIDPADVLATLADMEDRS